MTISPISYSYSNYQNVYNMMKKNNNLQNPPQNPENQIAFKGLGNIATKPINPTTSKKLLTTITILGATALGFIGVKLPKVKAVDKLLDDNKSLDIKKENPQAYKTLLKIYTENPELVTNLMQKKLYLYWHENDQEMAKYSIEDIIAISDISTANPSLTQLAKDTLQGFYSRVENNISKEKEQDIREQAKQAILEKPEKVSLIMKRLKAAFHKTRTFDTYFKSDNDYYTVETMLQELEKYEKTEELELKKLEAKYPEIVDKMKEQCSITRYKGDLGELADAYDESTKYPILKAYDEDPAKGEKMLEIFYDMHPTTANEVRRELEKDPSIIEELYNEAQNTKDAYVPMKRIEFKRLDTERMLLMEELYYKKPTPERKTEITNRLNEINSKIKGGFVMSKTVDNPNDPTDTFTHYIFL